MTEIVENNIERALVVVAHPDDAEFGCSGTVSKWTRQGVEVNYVICTNGAAGTSERTLNQQKITDIRKIEQRNACDVLGVKDLTFLDYPDGMLEPTLDLRRDITRQIRKYKPNVVVSAYPNRTFFSSTYLGHPDHCAAGEATLSAIYPASRDFLAFPELLKEDLAPWKTEQVYILSYGQIVRPEITFYSLLTAEDVDKSVAALLCHKSQIPKPEDVAVWMKERRANLAKITDAKFAEIFTKITLG